MGWLETTSRAVSTLEAGAARLAHKKAEIKQSISREQKNSQAAQQNLDDLLKARELLKALLAEMEGRLCSRLDMVVNAALAHVFPGRYTFKSKFELQKDKSTVRLSLVGEDGNTIGDVVDSCGGGVVDVVGFALQVAAYTIKKTLPILILDEPFKHLSADRHEACSMMVKAISSDVKIQVVMISHLPKIVAFADKVFVVEQEGGISNVVGPMYDRLCDRVYVQQGSAEGGSNP